MDISGEHQLDVDHNIFKKRLAPTGEPLEQGPTKEHGFFLNLKFYSTQYFFYIKLWGINSKQKMEKMFQ